MPTDKNKNLTDKVKEIKVTDSNQFLARKLLLQQIKDSKDSKNSIKKNANGGEIKPRTMNKGGGMDMGKKEEPTQWITKKEKPKKWITKKSRGGGMDMGQMPNTVKPEPRGNPGVVETVVGKGSDYIKDLID